MTASTARWATPNPTPEGTTHRQTRIPHSALLELGALPARAALTRSHAAYDVASDAAHQSPTRRGSCGSHRRRRRCGGSHWGWSSTCPDCTKKHSANTPLHLQRRRAASPKKSPHCKGLNARGAAARHPRSSQCPNGALENHKSFVLEKQTGRRTPPTRRLPCASTEPRSDASNAERIPGCFYAAPPLSSPRTPKHIKC